MKKRLTRILYQNSTDCGEGMVIKFEDIDMVLDKMCAAVADGVREFSLKEFMKEEKFTTPIGFQTNQK